MVLLCATGVTQSWIGLFFKPWWLLKHETIDQAIPLRFGAWWDPHVNHLLRQLKASWVYHITSPMNPDGLRGFTTLQKYETRFGNIKTPRSPCREARRRMSGDRAVDGADEGASGFQWIPWIWMWSIPLKWFSLWFITGLLMICHALSCVVMVYHGLSWLIMAYHGWSYYPYWHKDMWK